MPLPTPLRRIRRSIASTVIAPILGLAGLASPANATSAPDDLRLPQVVITGTRHERIAEEAPVRTEVVDRAELERLNAVTLRDALEHLPGVLLREIHGKSGYEISMQGLTSDQVLVLIDGLPITASTGSTVDLGQYLLAEVERVEIVKGAASVQYGSSAMGGVINVITRRIQPGLNGSITVDAGTRLDQNPSGDRIDAATRHARFSLAGGAERWRMSIHGDVVRDAGFAVDPGGWSRQGDEVRRAQYGARVEWLPIPMTRYWVDAGVYRERSTQRFLYRAPPNLVPQSKLEDIDRTRFGAGAVWTGGSGLRAELKGVDERYDSDSNGFSNSVLQRRRHATQRMTHVSGQLDLPAWRKQLWQLGFDWHRETLEQTNNGITELAHDTARGSREIYLQNDLFIGDRWELVLGMRWQDDSDFGSHLVPKIALRADLPQTGDWRGVLRASYGQGYRVPNLKERHFLFDHSSLGYLVLGNPELKPERSDSLQLGASFEVGRSLSFEVHAFRNLVDDLIQIDEANAQTVDGIAIYRYRNVARARTAGIEAGARWRPAPGLQLSASWTLMRTRDLDRGTELTRRPRQVLRAGLDWQAMADTRLSLRARAQSDELVDSRRAARSSGWGTLDLAIDHRLTRRTSAFFGIDNLFDRQRDFADPDDFGPLSGRLVYVGIRHLFGTTHD